MDVRTTFIVGIAIIFITFYWLEKEIKKEQIFWLYAGFGILFGIAAAYAVAKDMSSYDYYIKFAVIFIIAAILYYDYEESEVKEVKKPEMTEEDKKKAESQRRSYEALLQNLEKSYRKEQISEEVYEAQKKEYQKKLEELG